jgi:hypothetical protein
MKNLMLFLAVAFASGPTLAQDTSGYEFFYNEQLEGVYGNNWYVKHIEQDGLYHHFSILADGKEPYEGVFITACIVDMQDQFINGKSDSGSEYFPPSDDVINAFYMKVCPS